MEKTIIQNINQKNYADSKNQFMNAISEKVLAALNERKTEICNEISKQTLGRYVDKAASDLRSRAFDSGVYHADAPTKHSTAAIRNNKTMNNRVKGIQRAGAKLAKEDCGKASAEQEDKFHRDLDKLVHKTFGKSSDEKINEQNGYVAFYKGRRTEVYANTSYEAQKKAAEFFKAKKSYDVTVKLAEKDGKQVTHVATEAAQPNKNSRMNGKD